MIRSPMRILVLVLAGCGRIGFDPVGDGPAADVTMVNVVGELDPTFRGTGIVTPSAVTTGVAYARRQSAIASARAVIA